MTYCLVDLSCITTLGWLDENSVTVTDMFCNGVPNYVVTVLNQDCSRHTQLCGRWSCYVEPFAS